MHPTPDFYQKNLTSLKEHQPEAWAIINSASPCYDIITTQGERPNLEVTTKNGEKILLHNATDEQAALQIVQKDARGTAVFFGMGLGYGALALCTQRPKIRHIIIFEIHPGIFAQALHCHDLTPLLSDPRLILVLGLDHQFPQTLAPAALTIQLEHSYILKHQPSFAIAPAAYEKLHDEIYNLINGLNIDANTGSKFGETFLRNIFANVKSIHHNYLLEDLHGSLKNIPAILVAGGPSLNKNIAQLHKAKGKALIIAVDTTLPALLTHGIIPDIVGAVDSQKLAYEKIADVATMASKTFLTCTPTVYSKTPKTFPAKQIIWGFSHTPLEQSVNRAFGGSTIIEASTTVAHMNLAIAASLGCSPLILIGQDLSFPVDGNNDHVDGAVISAKRNKINFNKNDKQLLWVDGTLGGKVATDRAYLFIKHNLESLIDLYPGHYINATEGGAHINGTEVLPLEETINTHCTETHDTTSILEAALAQNGHPDNNQLIAWLGATLTQTRELQKITKKIDKLTVDANKIIVKLNKTGKPYHSFSALPANLQKQINKIDKTQEQSDQPMEIWFILKEITKAGLRESERLKQEILELQDQPSKYLEYAHKNLDRILRSNSVRAVALKLLEENLLKTLTFLEKEKELLSTTENDRNNEQHNMELARFYFNEGELVLAQPLFEHLHSNKPDSPEINFYLGCIAAEQANHENAAKFFNTAKTLSADLEKEISDFNLRLGNQYFDLWRKHPTALLLLKKGLKYYPQHQPILAQLDLLKISAAHKSSTPETTDGLILDWYKKLEEDKALAAKLTPEQAAELYAHHGQLLMSEARFTEATASFSKALEYMPENPDYHIIQTEAFFATGEFDRGIEHLKQAVKINPAYAKHWDEIGDQLRADGQFNDAIAAYENCFAAQPDNLEMLKKIGECYQAMKMPEAALKVYTLLKQHLDRRT